MSSFFTIPSSQKKRKRLGNTVGDSRKRLASQVSRESKSAPRRTPRAESISGSEDDSDDGPRDTLENSDELSSGSSDEGDEETAAERRLRLAERYLNNVRAQVAEDEVGFDAEQIDRDLIAERLQEDVAESKGRIYRKLADDLDFEGASHSWAKWNEQSVTGVASCDSWVYTVGKGMDLIKWKIQDLPAEQWLQTGKKRSNRSRPPPKKRPQQIAFVRGDKSRAKDALTYPGHVDTILCVAASQDGKYVATGGQDRRIVVWDTQSLKCLKVFNQHRDAVTALAFRRGTNQMYSASKDRTVKVWSLDELAYIETLFGHQDEVVDITALSQERCISVGARDRTARLWKVVEETQLVFRGGGGVDKKNRSINPQVLEGSMDRVAMIDDEMFVTGGDNGALSLWTIHKKKPVYTVSLSHGLEEPLSPGEASAETNCALAIIPQPQPRWITALAAVPYSDVILSGSWDGHVRAWKISEDKKKIESMGTIGTSVLGSIALKGVVNDISFFERGDRASQGISIVLAMGKEHRFGRWKKVPGKNGLVVLEVSRKGERT